jgi:hypothetical protein
MTKDETDPLEHILNGGRLTKTFKTKRGEFIMAFPLPSDLRAIEIDVAGMLDGNPQTSFNPNILADFRAYATLRRMITNAPEWWNNLQDPEQCPDTPFVIDLYGRYLRFCKETREAVAKSSYRGTVGVVRHSDDTPEKMGDRTLPGSADRPEVQGTDG